MRYLLLIAIIAVTVLGCARGPTTPGLPGPDGATGPLSAKAADVYHDPHRLWGEWTFFIDETHEKIDVVPQRYGRLHLNALKFLEEYCTDCLEITHIRNNGDGTIDLTVKITHPFPGFPQYTGFDVKGIIMFQGSHEFPDNMEKYPLYPQNFWASWRLMGDPELLNADGYSYHWSPWYDSGSDMPIFNYWPGKYSNGTPTANVNGYLNFYSNENRHMFECDRSVSRTYRIWLPPGPVVAAYAVDACWEPPLVMPVTNPIEDFPITANQPEAYHFKVVMCDGEPIEDERCCTGDGSVHKARAEIDLWYRLPEALKTNCCVGIWDEWIRCNKAGISGHVCDGPPNWYCIGPCWFHHHPNGVYQFVAVEHHAPYPPQPPNPVWYPSLDLFEVVIDIE